MVLPSFPLPFTAALLAGLAVVVLLRDRAASARARTLFALFLAAGGMLAFLAGLRFGYRSITAGELRPVLAMTPGPLSYLAFRALTAAPNPPWWRDLLRHFWPMGLAAALVLLDSPALDLVIAASFATYAALLARMWAQGPDALVNSSLGDGPHLRMLLAAIVFLHLLSAVVDLTLMVDFATRAGAEAPLILTAVNVVLIASLAGFLLARPNRPAPAEPPRAPGSVVASPEDLALMERLATLMREQRLYRDPDLTIARVARRAGVPARRISQAVNRSSGLNVSQYINDHRVAEAKRLLGDPGRSISTVMLDAGFQTKSNFNREFRRVTGDSPSGWRQRHAAVD